MSEKITYLVVTLQNSTEVKAMKEIIGEWLFLTQDDHTGVKGSEEATRVAQEIDRYISTHEKSPSG